MTPFAGKARAEAAADLSSFTRVERMLSGTWALAILLTIHTLLLAWMAASDSPTNDEPFHLAGGLRRLQDGVFDVDRGTPLSSTIAALPVDYLQPATDWTGIPDSFAVGRAFLSANGERSFWLITVGRWACIPFSLLGCVICWRWARELHGPIAGFLAAAYWTFCPNILAHGHLVTGDVAAASLGTAALYAYWKWLEAPEVARALSAGLVLGTALLTKHVMLLLYPLFILFWLLWIVCRPASRQSWGAQCSQLAIMVIASLWLVNLAYLYRGVGEPLARYRIGSWLLDLGGKHDAASHSLPASLPVPLPEDFVLGVDEIDHIYSTRRKASYLAGEFSQNGWWYYYPYAVFVKTPLGTLGLFGLAILVSLTHGSGSALRHELLLLTAILALFDFVTMVTSIQAHVRYVLPAFPWALIWASKVASPDVWKNRALRGLVCVSLLATVGSSLRVFPHSLSYFNELAGGPLNGHAHLLESNIDWGQDLLHLKRWIDRHPEARPLHLAYQGLVDPAIIGIESRDVPKLRGYTGEELQLPINQLGPQPGWHAVCVQQMRSKPYDYFLRRKPVALAGYSFYIFRFTCEDANQLRGELGLPPLDCSTDRSSGEEP